MIGSFYCQNPEAAQPAYNKPGSYPIIIPTFRKHKKTPLFNQGCPLEADRSCRIAHHICNTFFALTKEKVVSLLKHFG